MIISTIKPSHILKNSDGDYQIVKPTCNQPKGYKQVCISCGFDKFENGTTYEICPSCQLSVHFFCRYVAIEPNTTTLNPQAHTPVKSNDANVDLIRLVDQVDEMTTKTTSILKVMSGFFAECQGTLYDKDALYWTTQAAIEEIKKIDKAVTAYANAQGGVK